MPGYQPLGKFPPFHQSGGKVSFSQIRGGIINAEEVILAGGTRGRIRSENYDPTNETGWGIFGDGSASFYGDVFFGENAIFQGDLYSANWDGTIPVDLSSYDAGATAGFALDSSEGTAQFMGDVFVGGDLRLRGGTARFGTGPVGGPRIDMVAGQSADGEDNALFTMFYLTNVADPTIISHPSIVAFVGARGTPGETTVLSLRSGAYDSDGRARLTITSRSLDGSSNPEAIVRVGGGSGGPTRFAASDAAFFDDRTFFSDGSASQPAISFQSDTDTGLFWPSSGKIGVSLNGVESFRFELGKIGVSLNGVESFRFAAGVHPSDHVFYAPVTGGPQLVADDSGTIPVFTFTNDDDTGMYRSAANELSFSVGGTVKLQMAAGRVDVNDALRLPDGSAANPAFRFISDTNTGIYRAGSDRLGIAVGGANRIQFANNPHIEIGFVAAGNVGIRFWENGIGELSRSYRMERTPNFGGFRFVGVTSAGTETVAYEIYDDGQFRVRQGSASSPGLTFIDDNNTGIYRPSADIVAFTTGGTLRGSFQNDGFYATTPNATGSAANLVTAGAGHNNFMRSTSARRYKTEITYNPEQLLAVELRPAKFYRPDDDAWYYGFIADDLAEEDPLLGTFDPETGEIENYDQRAVMAVMAAKLNEMARKIRELEDEVARLRGEKEIY